MNQGLLKLQRYYVGGDTTKIEQTRNRTLLEFFSDVEEMMARDERIQAQQQAQATAKKTEKNPKKR